MNRNPVKEPGEFWPFVFVALLCVWIYLRLR